MKSPTGTLSAYATSDGDGDVFVLKDGQDAISRFGFGIMSYFQLLKVFLFYFTVLTLLYSPVIGNYMKYKSKDAKPKKLFENMLMGNMG